MKLFYTTILNNSSDMVIIKISLQALIVFKKVITIQ